MRLLAPRTFLTAGPADKARLKDPSAADLLKDLRDILRPSISILLATHPIPGMAMREMKTSFTTDFCKI
jgi:hypothetical protein